MFIVPSIFLGVFILCFLNFEPYMIYLQNLSNFWTIFVYIGIIGSFVVFENENEIKKFRDKVLDEYGNRKIRYHIGKFNCFVIFVQAIVACSMGWWWTTVGCVLLSLISYSFYDKIDKFDASFKKK